MHHPFSLSGVNKDNYVTPSVWEQYRCITPFLSLRATQIIMSSLLTESNRDASPLFSLSGGNTDNYVTPSVWEQYRCITPFLSLGAAQIIMSPLLSESNTDASPPFSLWGQHTCHPFCLRAIQMHHPFSLSLRATQIIMSPFCLRAIQMHHPFLSLRAAQIIMSPLLSVSNTDASPLFSVWGQHR